MRVPSPVIQTRFAFIFVAALAFLLWGSLGAATSTAWAQDSKVETRELVEKGKLEARWQVRQGKDGRDVRHGRFLRFHPDGKPSLEAWYKDDQATGIWTWWDKDGHVVRSVEHEYGVPVPLRGESIQEEKYAFTQLNGRKTAEGLLKGDKPHGKWQFWHNNGVPKAEGEYLTGIPNGRWVYYTADGQIEREAHFEMGILHGEYREAHRNGQERSHGMMDQGLKVGHWRYWFPNGQVSSEGDYVNDRMEGEWRFWTKEGALIRRLVYRNGEAVQELEIPDDARSRATAKVTTETDIRPLPMLEDEQGEIILPRER